MEYGRNQMDVNTIGTTPKMKDHETFFASAANTIRTYLSANARRCALEPLLLLLLRQLFPTLS
jgi:hypothetical protein